MVYRFRLWGSAHYCELHPSDMEGNYCIIEDAISRKLCGRSPLMIVHDIRLEFLFTEYHYLIRVVIQCLGESGNDDGLKAHIEGLITMALLEFFGEGLTSF
ncbi:MAG TPA: hypothetical protein VNG51_21370 [Ktedonobacteraceae bacterium]|nr:hypothetical protein [Ktedonobacteraceae bacterium]